MSPLGRQRPLCREPSQMLSAHVCHEATWLSAEKVFPNKKTPNGPAGPPASTAAPTNWPPPPPQLRRPHHPAPPLPLAHTTTTSAAASSTPPPPPQPKIEREGARKSSLTGKREKVAVAPGRSHQIWPRPPGRSCRGGHQIRRGRSTVGEGDEDHVWLEDRWMVASLCDE
jgi:hypothetical protein